MRDRATLYVEQLSGSAGGVEAVVEKPERLPLRNLENALQQYLAGPMDKPFDFDSVPEDIIVEEPKTKKAGPSTAPGFPSAVEEAAKISEYIDQLKSIPQIAELGPLFKSCEPVSLTEEGTEYGVTLIKHIFEAHIVFQFSCTNTVAEHVLEDVKVVLDLAEAVRNVQFEHTKMCFRRISKKRH